MESDIKALIGILKTSTEQFIRASMAKELAPEAVTSDYLSTLVNRAESKMRAAEISLLAVVNRAVAVTKGGA